MLSFWWQNWHEASPFQFLFNIGLFGSSGRPKRLGQGRLLGPGCLAGYQGRQGVLDLFYLQWFGPVAFDEPRHTAIPPSIIFPVSSVGSVWFKIFSWTSKLCLIANNTICFHYYMQIKDYYIYISHFVKNFFIQEKTCFFYLHKSTDLAILKNILFFVIWGSRINMPGERMFYEIRSASQMGSFVIHLVTKLVPSRLGFKLYELSCLNCFNLFCSYN
jgi:hypothetical protein